MTVMRGWIALIGLLLPAFLTPLTAADEVPPTLFVVDGSGSMWAEFGRDKRSRIDTVKDVLKPYLTAVPMSKIGFESFGHRRKSDCSDVEVIAPLSNSAAAAAALELLNPRGKGPVSLALRQADSALRGEHPAQVILIADGSDNCQGDPCAAATEIAKSSPALRFNVIGLDLEPNDSAKMSCVARVTGGLFADAHDADQLSAALAAVLGAPSTPIAIAGPAPTLPPATSGLAVSAILADGEAPISTPVVWSIFKAGSAAPIASVERATLSIDLEPGSYEVEATIGLVAARVTATIESGRATTLAVPLNAGRIRLNRATDPGLSPAATDASSLVSVSKIDGEVSRPVWIGPATPTDLFLPPGSYGLTAHDIASRPRVDFAIAAGEEKDVAFALATGKIELSFSPNSGDASQDGILAIEVDDQANGGSLRLIGRARGASAEFTVPAGTYFVSARLGQRDVREQIAVGPGGKAQRIFELPSGKLVAKAQLLGNAAGAAAGLRWHIFNAEKPADDPLTSTGENLDIALAPGRYRVLVQTGDGAVKTEQNITIEAGKTSNATIDVPVGKVELRSAGNGSLFVPGERLWSIVDRDGRSIFQSLAEAPDVHVMPGRYQIRLGARDTRFERSLEIAAGDTIVVEF